MRRALAVAAKAPQPGTVKTRLHSLLSTHEATELYKCFLRDTLLLTDSLPETETIISYTPQGSEKYFEDLRLPRHKLILQRGESFGDKLFNALNDMLGAGFDLVAIMNADSPTLPGEYLAKAFDELERPGDRVVLGPSEDGGYYLIGIKRRHKELFENIAWSTEHVMRQTIERARQMDLEVSLLPAWYDVDGAADFERLIAELRDTESVQYGSTSLLAEINAPHTRRFLLSRKPREARESCS
jgi:rSAM/selenodomain-associated transferase 1